MSAQPATLARVQVRPAEAWEIALCHAMRETFFRPFVGTPPPVAHATWFVAVTDGHNLVACVSFVVGDSGNLIVLDLYDDGTRDGKRGILAIFEEFKTSGRKLQIVVPLDRPGLIAAIERRGAAPKSIVLEYPT